MADVTSICNRALQIIGAERITSIDEDSPNARSCKACYEPRRDALLRAFPWGFSIKRASLPADVDAPAFGYSTSFQWPSGALRILSPDPGNSRPGWTMEGRKILIDQAGPLQVRFVDTITDVGTMDPLFREALAADMGAEMAEEITQSNAKQQVAEGKKDKAIAEARRVGSIERGAQFTADDSWVSVRQT